MSEKSSIEYLMNNIYNNGKGNVITIFPKFQIIQGIKNETFYIVFDIINKSKNVNEILSNIKNDEESIIISININRILITDNINKVIFIDGDNKPQISSKNNNLRVTIKRNKDTYVYYIFYKSDKIAEISYTSYDLLLNSVFFDNIYLENIKDIDEQYQKLRVYPDDVIVNLEGNVNMSNVISFILTNYIVRKYDSDIDEYYVIQMNHYIEGFYAKKIYLYLKFLTNRKAEIIRVQEIEEMDVIKNNINTQNDNIGSFLGKRPYNSNIPLPQNKRK